MAIDSYRMYQHQGLNEWAKEKVEAVLVNVLFKGLGRQCPHTTDEHIMSGGALCMSAWLPDYVYCAECIGPEQDAPDDRKCDICGNEDDDGLLWPSSITGRIMLPGIGPNGEMVIAQPLLIFAFSYCNRCKSSQETGDLVAEYLFDESGTHPSVHFSYESEEGKR